MNKHALIYLLAAARATIDAALTVLTEGEPAEAPPEPAAPPETATLAARILDAVGQGPAPEPPATDSGECIHPPALRKACGTAGHPHAFLCHACKEIINGP